MSTGSPAETARSQPSGVSGTPLTPGTRATTPAPGGAATPAESSSSAAQAAREGSSTPAADAGRAGAASALPAVSRRSHPKSRTGCRTCKKRKIKPQCRNCVKHAVACDFLQSHARPSLGSGLSPGGAVLGALGGSGGGGDDLGASDLNMVDLELIHNFTTFTHATLSSDPAVRQMMRTNAVRMALGCDYVMRALLAVSALHLAHYRPDRRDFYVARALQHHQIASQAVIPSMGDLSYDNCENLHLFSVLTLYFALGCPKRDDNSLIIGENVFPQWIFLGRYQPVIKVLDPPNYAGPLHALFQNGKSRWRIVLGSHVPVNPNVLADLQAAVNKACDDPALLEIYNNIITHLRRFLCMLLQPSAGAGTGSTGVNDEDEPMGGVGSTPGSAGHFGPLGPTQLEPWDIFIWQWTVAGNFLPLLQGPEARQEAVAIFAHFLILFKKLESQWWLEGWATHLIEKAWAMLDQEHRLWIQWPIEELGWVPPL
ncbi:hypothetical protein F5X68DRAFT_267289 [Plectosphaerella plurivora]|uniref:Zn(2)-C6 fungal-type domain-containing protein n=1 Tax=Plectosphaerella plurivora TaxID=936078 RepID=A0A9P8VKS8_9PEZI|nr:hypothetical protein F5X68DRAFT_267289 [Plectosphaerella plurivora]